MPWATRLWVQSRGNWIVQASELSPIVLNIFQLGCTTRPHCPPQDWLPYCLYPPCTLDNCHSLCPCLAVCLFTVALDHLCTCTVFNRQAQTALALYKHDMHEPGRHQSRTNGDLITGPASNFPLKRSISRLLRPRLPSVWLRKYFQLVQEILSINSQEICDKLLTRGFSGWNKQRERNNSATGSHFPFEEVVWPIVGPV